MTTALRRWSTTATGNASVAGGANTINFSEGQAPSTVNNSAREMMAQIRGWYTAAEASWIEQSNTSSIASQTVFKLSGDQTANWTANRRWRLRGGSTTRYGSVVSSSFTAETTITVTVDSGSLSASHSIAALSSIVADHIPANTYVTSASLATTVATLISSASLATSLATYLSSASAATALAFKQGSIILKDEGASLTSGSSTAFGVIDFVGTGVSVSMTTAVATVTITAGGATVLLDAQDITGAGTYKIDSSVITQAYKRFELILVGISTSSGTTTTDGNIRISGNNGTGYGSNVEVITDFNGAANTRNVVVEILNASVTTGTRVIRASPATSVPVDTFQSITTGYINAIEINVTNGSLDGSSTATLIGYR